MIMAKWKNRGIKVILRTVELDAPILASLTFPPADKVHQRIEHVVENGEARDLVAVAVGADVAEAGHARYRAGVGNQAGVARCVVVDGRL